MIGWDEVTDAITINTRPTIYPISVTSEIAANVSVSPSSAETGQTIIVTITPPHGQRLAANGITATGVTSFNGNTVGSTSVTFVKTAGATQINATFENIPPATYPISVASGIMPNISVSPTSAVVGQIITVTITPPTGQRLAANGITATGVASFNGNTVGSTSVTFVKTAGATQVNAAFENIQPTTYPITIASAVMAYISVNPTTAEVGQTITVAITPPTGQRLAINGITATSVTSFDGNTVGSTSVTFIKTAGATQVNASFENIQPTAYPITIAPTVTAYISVNPTTAEAGQTITVTIIPPTGQRLAANGITATGVTSFNGNTTGSTTVTFIKTAGITQVNASFENIQPTTYPITIAPAVTAHISVNPATAEVGQTITVTITPPAGQRLSANGVTATGVTSFTGNTVGSIAVTFVKTSGSTEINAIFEDVEELYPPSTPDDTQNENVDPED